MNKLNALTVLAALTISLAGCGAAPSATTNTETETAETSAAQTSTDEVVSEPTPAAQALANGTYQIAVDTDSSMFRCESCTLTVADGTYTASLSLPGEGFSRLYYGSAEEAAAAPDDQIYDYYLNDEGKYTFDIPVPALDEELAVAAFGHRRDTWYDHKIVFHAPESDAS